MAIEKKNADYFIHYCNGKYDEITDYIESCHGNIGFAFWTKLKELVTFTDYHFYDCNNRLKWGRLVKKAVLSDETINEILNSLAAANIIDAELWTKRIIWIPCLLEDLTELYRRRKTTVPNKPSIQDFSDIKPDNTHNCQDNTHNCSDQTSTIPTFSPIRSDLIRSDLIKTCEESVPEEPEPEEVLTGIVSDEPIGSCKSITKLKTVPKNKHPPTDSLFRKIQFYFEDLYGGEFTDYGKEGKAINGLIAKSRARSPTIDPFDLIKTVADKFKELKDAKVKYYVDQPCVPSSVNASGVWDRLLEKLRQEQHEDEQITSNDIADEFNDEVC